MELPAPDPNKLLQSWMEWERGEVTPGRVMANLKTGGLRELLEGIVAGGSSGVDRPADQADAGKVRVAQDPTGGAATGPARAVETGGDGGAGGQAAASSVPPSDALGGQPPTWVPVV
jgi:hypothetical protein